MPGAIGWAIVVLTLVVRAILIPLFRKQLVSQRRVQMLSPEVKEIQKRYKGDRVKMQQAQQELYQASAGSTRSPAACPCSCSSRCSSSCTPSFRTG